jgi:hypothetical protein
VNFQHTMTRVYAGIVAIPLGAILLASAIGGDSGNSYDYRDYDIEKAMAESSGAGGFAGSGKSEAQAYGSLGHLNPCLFIVCEGEGE